MDRDRRQGPPSPPESTEADTSAEAPPEAKPDALDALLEALVPAEGPQMSRGDALEKLAKASEAATRLEQRDAEDRYLIGEALLEFTGRKGHRALGYPTLGPCLRERFARGRSWCYQAMQFARAATRRDIAGMPWSVAELGLELLALTGAKSFGELAKKPLPATGPDGAPVRFPASEELLGLAIAELRARQRTPKSQHEEDGAKLAERQAQHVAVELYEEHLKRRPALREAGISAYLFEGEAHFRAKRGVALRGEAFEALALYLADLRRALKKD